MAKSADAIINPPLLTWARQTAGFDVDEAAQRLEVDRETLVAWERGVARPTVAKLRQAATQYKRPLAIFYLPEPPRDFQPLQDFRRLPDAEVGRLSPGLAAAIRRAHAVREAALELRELEDDPPGPPPQLGRSITDAEAFGEAARGLLGVALSDQFGWQDPRRALNAWIDAVARLDVLVLQVQRINTREMRGFSISADSLPVAVLNGADFPRGRVFTLMHEFAHILLHAAGVCDVLPRRRIRRPSDEIEVFCNQAAAAILMPREPFLAEPALRDVPHDGRWPESVLVRLSDRYSVSQESVVRRLYTLQLTNWEFLQEKQAQYREAYDAWRAAEAEKRREEEKPGGPSFYRMKVRDLGRGFIESALDAYHRRAITGSDLSEFLEVKLNQLPALQAELDQTGGARD